MGMRLLKIRYFLVVMLLALIVVGCSKRKVALDQKQFTALLVDMHMADGTLSLSRDYTPDREKKNYAYYNSVFKKYGIDKAQFDSCMYYYSAQTALFSKIYDEVIDELSKKQTEMERMLVTLKERDSVNYFPVPDTIILNSQQMVREFEIDSIVPGLYKFNTSIKFRVPEEGIENRITAYFVSPDDKDTLYVRKINVFADTMVRYYAWSQYVDSVYNRLYVKIFDTGNQKKIKERDIRIWGTTLFRPYVAENTARRMREGVANSRRNKPYER